MNLILFTLVSTFSIAICNVEFPSESITGYPKNPHIKNTSFSCFDKPGDGFYADMEAKCQSFHMCQGGKFESFLCPTGTSFNQKGQVCDFWYNVDCFSTADYYNQPASVNLESSDTVFDYQTIHEDGFVVPPKPLTESESVVEDLSEPVTVVPGNIPVDPLSSIPLLEPPIRELENSFSVIRPIEAVAKPTEIPFQSARVTTPENNEDMSVEVQEVHLIKIATIVTDMEDQEAQQLEIPTIATNGKTAAGGQEARPLEIPTIVTNEDTLVGGQESQPLEIPTIVTNEDTSVGGQEARPIETLTNGEASVSIQEAQSSRVSTTETTEETYVGGQEGEKVEVSTIDTDQVTSTESEKNQSKPNANDGMIPEPIVEDNDRIIFPENDDNPFFDPINHRSSDVTYPSSDVAHEKTERYVITLPTIEFLPHAQLDVAKPLPTMDGVRSLPEVYHGVVQPRVSPYEQEVEATSRVIDVSQPRVNLPGDEPTRGDVVQTESKLPQTIVTHRKPFIETKPILHKMGRALRLLKPIIKAIPLVYKVPSAVIGHESVVTRLFPEN